GQQQSGSLRRPPNVGMAVVTPSPSPTSERSASPEPPLSLADISPASRAQDGLRSRSNSKGSSLDSQPAPAQPSPAQLRVGSQVRLPRFRSRGKRSLRRRRRRPNGSAHPCLKARPSPTRHMFGSSSGLVAA